MTLTELPLTQINVHGTFLGSGLRRKFYQDFIRQAIQVTVVINHHF